LGRAAGSGLGRFERELNSSQIDKYYKVRLHCTFTWVVSPMLTSAKVLVRQSTASYSSHGMCKDVCGDAYVPAHLPKILYGPCLLCCQPVYRSMDRFLTPCAGAAVWNKTSVGIHARTMLKWGCCLVSDHHSQHPERCSARISLRPCALEAQYGQISTRHGDWSFWHEDSVR
jgi:hypothetical protein